MVVVIDVSNVTKTFRIPLDRQIGLKGTVINYLTGKTQHRDLTVLKNISFQVKKGDFMGITGCNGSGKSTLLKIIAGILTPNKGGVLVKKKLTPFLELGLGFQGELTGRDNVFLYGAILGMKRSQIEKKMAKVVEFSGLQNFMNMPLKNYSSGMQVRLAFSIAIQAPADILLVDEVLAVGDSEFQKKCYSVFDDFKKRKKTVLLVSHDDSIIERYCNRKVILHQGKIAQIF